MGKLADLGFRFSIDKVTDLDLDLQDLARSDVKFLKVGGQFLLDELTEVDGLLVLKSLLDLAAEDFSALTRRYGVEVVVEKVESERQVAELLDLNIGYGQGEPVRRAAIARSRTRCWPRPIPPAPTFAPTSSAARRSSRAISLLADD